MQVVAVPEGQPAPWLPSGSPSGTVADTEPFAGTLVDVGSDVIIMVTQ